MPFVVKHDREYFLILFVKKRKTINLALQILKMKGMYPIRQQVRVVSPLKM